MKICFLAGANSIHSKKWIEYFAKKGHEIHWISLTPLTEGNIENVKFYFIKGNLLFNIVYISRLLKKINPDIIHAHYAGINGFIGALSGFHPFVLTAWGSDILIASKSKIKKPFIKFALKKADLITCDAQHMREVIIKLEVDLSKIKIINFGIDTKKFSFGLKNYDLIQKLKIQNCPVVISLRSLNPIYNISMLIKSIPIVLKTYPKTVFIIVGKGSEEEKLKNLAKKLKVFENIRFVGFISNNNLPNYLRISDVYVSTSLSDAGIAASTAEAMSCGLPVVVTNIGENKLWVKDEENGYIIPIKNSKILAEKIIYLFNNDKEKLKFGEINAKIIKKRNNYYKEMEKMENIYKKLINIYET